MKCSCGVFFCFLFILTACNTRVVKTSQGYPVMRPIKDGNEKAGLSVETSNERLSKRNKCCKLGREVAKVGDMCSYAGSLAALKPDPRHFHVIKTSLWQDGEDANPIKARKLQKCKRFKAYYEKCCRTEAANIEKDIKRHLDKQNKDRSNSVEELQTGRR